MVARVNTPSPLLILVLALVLTLLFGDRHMVVDRRLHAIISVEDIEEGESAEGNTGNANDIVRSLPPALSPARILNLLHVEVEEGGLRAMKGVVPATVIGEIRRHLEIEVVVAATQRSRLAHAVDLGRQDQEGAVARLVPFHLAVARRAQGPEAERAKIYATADHAVPHQTKAEARQCLKTCVRTHK